LQPGRPGGHWASVRGGYHPVADQPGPLPACPADFGLTRAVLYSRASAWSILPRGRHPLSKQLLSFKGGGMRAYRPDLHVGAFDAVLLFLMSILVGFIAGTVLFLLSRLISLIFVFPILIGFIGAILMGLGVRGTQIRHPLFAGLLGVLAGIILYVTYHYL